MKWLMLKNAAASAGSAAIVSEGDARHSGLELLVSYSESYVDLLVPSARSQSHVLHPIRRHES